MAVNGKGLRRHVLLTAKAVMQAWYVTYSKVPVYLLITDTNAVEGECYIEGYIL